MARISVKTKGMFDRYFLRKYSNSLRQNPLRRAGAFIRRTAIGLIRTDRTKKQRPSKPGRPPKSRAPGHPLKQILYAITNNNNTVIVGAKGMMKDVRAVPGRHEHGGLVEIKVKVPRRRIKSSPTQRAAFRSRVLAGKTKPYRPGASQVVAIRRVNYPKRPFMKPALDKNRLKLKSFWRDALRK